MSLLNVAGEYRFVTIGPPFPVLHPCSSVIIPSPSYQDIWLNCCPGSVSYHSVQSEDLLEFYCTLTPSDLNHLNQTEHSLQTLKLYQRFKMGGISIPHTNFRSNRLWKKLILKWRENPNWLKKKLAQNILRSLIGIARKIGHWSASVSSWLLLSSQNFRVSVCPTIGPSVTQNMEKLRKERLTLWRLSHNKTAITLPWIIERWLQVSDNSNDSRVERKEYTRMRWTKRQTKLAWQGYWKYFAKIDSCKWY